MDKITVTRSSMPSYEEYIERIKPLWESRWLTNNGENYKELEEKLKEFMDVPYISLMVNGHMALEMAIQVMEFPEGSEVITTPFTFISTTHAIVRNKLKPVFCDIKSDDYTINPDLIENLITEKTVAIIPVHVYGNVCDVDAIQKIAYKYGLKVIYDAAHAFAESYKGIGIGNFGDASIFSFHATKIYNTIEGGAVTFADSNLYEKLYNVKNFGIRGEELVVHTGANAKMNEFSAIMGLCNLPYVHSNIEARKERADWYMELLGGNDKIKMIDFSRNCEVRNYGYFALELSDEKTRDQIYDKLREQNVFSRKYFYPLTSDAACFRNHFKNISLVNARRISSCILVLPLYPELKRSEIEFITNIVLNNI